MSKTSRGANNTWELADFAEKAPGLDWTEYFRGAGLTGHASFVVWQPAAFIGESALVASAALNVWKDWLAYHLIEDYASVLPKAFADLAHFNAATARLATQYDTYKPFPDLALNGRQTLAENIADLAGLAAAYNAYHASLAGKAVPAEDGFSGDQQFFLGFAQKAGWASKQTEGALRQQVMTDPHAPPEFRVDLVLAFDVQSGTKLHLAPGDRVRVW